ncbi:MAG: hypothetical protein LBF86_06505 [Helicobacteraceae bacterium]|nr:hypothetical protein [Helicobacteraceae bacterium]
MQYNFAIINLFRKYLNQINFSKRRVTFWLFVAFEAVKRLDDRRLSSVCATWGARLAE